MDGPPDTSRVPTRVRQAIAAVALICLVALLVPWQPKMPLAGLDPSWVQAINEAAALGRRFGTDIVFTYGPLGSVLTEYYHPATDARMVLGSLLVFGAYAVTFGALAAPRRLWLVVPFAVASSIFLLRDSLFMVLPLMALLYAIRLALPPTDPVAAPVRPASVAVLLLAAAASAVTPLVKASLVATVAFELALAAIVVGRRHRSLAVAVVATAIAAFAGAWIACGQSLRDLPALLANQGEIVSGYTAAMALYGDARGLLGYLVGAAALLGIYLAGVAPGRGWPALVGALGIAALFFVLLKAGYVRYGGHQLMAAHALLIVSLLIATLARGRWWVGLLVCGIAGWAVVERVGREAWPVDAPRRLMARTQATADGIRERLADPAALARRHGEALDRIRATEPLPPVDGAADLYPFDLALLFANRIAWSGRPALQSYSAYTPRLDQLDSAHVLAPDGPRHLFFDLFPIDGRLPALEDASTIPLLLTHFRPVGVHGRYTHFERRSPPDPSLLDRTSRAAVVVEGQLGDRYPVPAADLVIARIDVRPTLYGRLRQTAYKLPRARIVLTLSDGREVAFRYIPEMGRTGFVLSPLLLGSTDLVELASGLGGPVKVTSFRLEGLRPSHWERPVTVTLQPASITPDPTLRSLVLTGPSPSPSLPVEPRAADAATVCYLDLVDGQPTHGAPPGALRARDANLGLLGWASPDPGQGRVGDTTWLVLQRPDQPDAWFRAGTFVRPDVAAAYSRPELARAGFQSRIDLSAVPPPFRIRIRIESGGRLIDCGTDLAIGR